MATSLFKDPIYRRFALQRPIAVIRIGRPSSCGASVVGCGTVVLPTKPYSPASVSSSSSSNNCMKDFSQPLNGEAGVISIHVTTTRLRSLIPVGVALSHIDE